jgi:hypothetical protein
MTIILELAWIMLALRVVRLALRCRLAPDWLLLACYRRLASRARARMRGAPEGARP